MCLFRRIRRIRRFVNSLLLTIPLLFIFFKLIKWFNKRSEAKKQQEIEDRMANLEKRIAKLENQH